MLRPVLSVVVAFLAAVIGFPLAWQGGGGAYRFLQIFMGPSAERFGTIALLLVGAVLLLAVGASIALSGLGALFAGAWHLLLTLLIVGWPFDPMAGVQSPVLEVIFEVASPASEFGIGSLMYLIGGSALIAGAVLTTAGAVTLRPRPTPTTATARLVGGIVGAVLLLGAVVLASFAGAAYYRELFILYRPDGLSVVLLLVALVLAVAGAVSARWTALGLVVVGALTSILGALMVLAPQALFAVPPLRDVVPMGATGSVLVLGVLILGSGVGVAVHGRRRPATAEVAPTVTGAAAAPTVETGPAV